MRVENVPCAHCKGRGHSLFLHHGKLFCRRCLMADERDEMTTKVRIAILHAQAAREESVKKRDGRR
jgi:uncharacterized Zn finger protein (UPF0148 family)